jgi:hypothetical protein
MPKETPKRPGESMPKQPPKLLAAAQTEMDIANMAKMASTPTEPPPVTRVNPAQFVERLTQVIFRMTSTSNCALDRQRFLYLHDYLMPQGRHSKPLRPQSEERATLATRADIIYAGLVAAINAMLQPAEIEQGETLEHLVAYIEWAVTAEKYVIVGDQGLGFKMVQHRPEAEAEATPAAE